MGATARSDLYGWTIWAAVPTAALTAPLRETLIVFAVFSVTFLGEKLTMNHAVGFALILAGAWFVFRGPL